MPWHFTYFYICHGYLNPNPTDLILDVCLYTTSKTLQLLLKPFVMSVSCKSQSSERSSIQNENGIILDKYCPKGYLLAKICPFFNLKLTIIQFQDCRVHFKFVSSLIRRINCKFRSQKI